MRYFLLKDENTLEVYLSQELEEQPENSIPFQVCEWKRAKFDKFPNPTKIEEMEFEEIVEVPFEVPLWAIRNIMRKVNIFNLVIEYINTLEEPLRTDAIDYLEYGNYVERYSNTVLLIQQIAQMSEKEVDNLFINASKLTL